MIRLQNLKIKSMISLKLLRRSSFGLVLALTGLAMTIAMVGSPVVNADQFTNQINALEQQNSQDASNLSSLQSQATTYQQEVNQLASQIASIQAQIANTQSQISTTQN